MGGVSIWKPASSAMLSAYYVMRVLEAAGMPPGVINFLPGSAGMITDNLLASSDLAGIHFTGSTEVFQSMWKTVGTNVARYRSYPRLVGETGGKDFIVAHPSADPEALAVAIVRGGFEYQGQKCSAASRIYVPQSLWKGVRDHVIAMMQDIKMGDPRDFRNFVSAVIDKKAFDKISSYIAEARKSAKVLQGGKCDDSKGYFIEPTLVQTTKPDYKLLCEEIFGPVVTTYVYPDDKWKDTLKTVDKTSPYALTGAVFANDRQAVREASAALRNAAGNFYINDKPTGAVVGSSPFGGARASGTNDKAGFQAESDPVGQHADNQGNACATARLSLPIHGRGVTDGAAQRGNSRPRFFPRAGIGWPECAPQRTRVLRKAEGIAQKVRHLSWHPDCSTQGMAIFTKTSTNEVREVEWLHWLFIRGHQALSCDVDVRGDGFYAVSLFPLWRAGEATIETFTRPGEALRRHAEITDYLHASGWLLAEGGPVASFS
jgi:hypothetical protein